MRVASFASFAPVVLLSLTAAFADSRPQTTTYVDGNLNGVSPNSGGTLMFSDEKAMYLHTGLETVAIPYEGIDKAELGAVKETSHDVPFYKVWARRHPKTQTQYLIVNFKNEQGEDKTMTLELDTAAASSVLADLETRTGKKFAAETAAADENKPELKTERPAKNPATPAPAAAATTKPADGWWGDSMWKTSRNADKWSKPTGTIAPDQQQ